MKLIATRSFRNTHNIDLNGDGKISADEKFITHGTVFYIGAKLPFAKMTAGDKEMVALLNHARCIGDGDDSKVVEAVKAEVELAKRHEERAAKTQMAAGSAADLIKQLVEALGALQKAAKGPKSAEA